MAASSSNERDIQYRKRRSANGAKAFLEEVVLRTRLPKLGQECGGQQAGARVTQCQPGRAWHSSLKAVMAARVPDSTKMINPVIPGAPHTPSQINTKNTTARHTVIQLLPVGDKEKVLK